MGVLDDLFAAINAVLSKEQNKKRKIQKSSVQSKAPSLLSERQETADALLSKESFSEIKTQNGFTIALPGKITVEEPLDGRLLDANFCALGVFCRISLLDPILYSGEAKNLALSLGMFASVSVIASESLCVRYCPGEAGDGQLRSYRFIICTSVQAFVGQLFVGKELAEKKGEALVNRILKTVKFSNP